MTQINVNDPDGNVERTPVQPVAPVTRSDAGTGHAVAAGINLITTLVVLAVAIVLVYLIFQMIMPMVRVR